MFFVHVSIIKKTLGMKDPIQSSLSPPPPPPPTKEGSVTSWSYLRKTGNLQEREEATLQFLVNYLSLALWEEYNNIK